MEKQTKHITSVPTGRETKEQISEFGAFLKIIVTSVTYSAFNSGILIASRTATKLASIPTTNTTCKVNEKENHGTCEASAKNFVPP